MTDEELLNNKIRVLEDLLIRAIPVREGAITSWNKDYAKKYVDKVILWMIGRDKAEELIRNYLKTNKADYYINDAIRFIYSN